jgi:hypothetical protein
MFTSNSTLKKQKLQINGHDKRSAEVKNKEPHGIIRLDHYWNLAHIEWIEVVLPPKPEEFLCQAKRYTKIMELFRTTILNINKQWWKICPRLYALF